MTGIRPPEPDQVSIVLSAINEKLGPAGLICPLSHDNNWKIHRYFTTIPGFPTLRTNNPFEEAPTRSFPFAVVTCETCGYTIFINLITLGVADKLGIKVLDE